MSENIQSTARAYYPTMHPVFESQEDVCAQAERMAKFYLTGATRPIDHRRAALMKLKAYLKANEEQVLGVLHEDLGKAPFEAYATELGIVYDEINTCLKNLSTWMRPRKVPTSIVHFPSFSTIYPSPMGVVLVLAPWNYPIQLALVPLVDAIAAGNCVAVKPSRTSSATGNFIVNMLADLFPSEFICGFPGSGDMNDWLLKPHWDFVCFTGSPAVGKTIMGAAAEHLTPVLLELGGKSPCIIDKTANITRAAQRIAWGKGVNSGQTCVAPDYLLVHEDVAVDLAAALDVWFHQYYGDDILACPEWPHIITQHHFERIMGLIENHNPKAFVAFGGHGDPATRKIEPTCLMNVTLDDPVMGEEIFGPVLPMLTYRTLDEAFDLIRHFPTPLASYIFSDDTAVQQRVIQELAFGGCTINDVLIHLANNHMGFGGFGNSGMGQYHGKVGFDTFTHYKSTLRKSNLIEMPIRVPPFGDKIKLLRLLMP